jgi:GTPase SAR1 family protein
MYTYTQLITIYNVHQVGKTTLVSQFLWGTYIEKYVPTEAEEFNWIEYEVSPEHTLTLKVIDMCATCEFPAMRQLYFENSHAFLLVFRLVVRHIYITCICLQC